MNTYICSKIIFAGEIIMIEKIKKVSILTIVIKNFFNKGSSSSNEFNLELSIITSKVAMEIICFIIMFGFFFVESENKVNLNELNEIRCFILVPNLRTQEHLARQINLSNIYELCFKVLGNKIKALRHDFCDYGGG